MISAFLSRKTNAELCIIKFTFCVSRLKLSSLTIIHTIGRPGGTRGAITSVVTVGSVRLGATWITRGDLASGRPPVAQARKTISRSLTFFGFKYL
jgi:hypothetical protein